MRKGRLVSPATAERLWSAKPELQSPDVRLRLRRREETPSAAPQATAAASPGSPPILDIYLDTGWTVVVLSNLDGGMQPVAQKLREVAGRIR